MHVVTKIFGLLLYVALAVRGKEQQSQELNPYTSALKQRFEKAFFDSCPKYPFVKQWVDGLDNAMSQTRFVTFMYHEPGLKNGGLGDRLGM